MIRPATRQEIDSLLSSRGIKAPENLMCECFLVEQGAYQMLLLCQNIDDARCEVHICYPKEYRIRSRAMCIESLDWLFEQGYQQVYTQLPENDLKTTHNLCKKIGFVPVGCYNGNIIYERAKSCHQQQY